MSMVDTFNDTLNAIRRFIYANVPDGTDSDRLERTVENSTNYFAIEFRRDDVSVSLYIEIDSFHAESFMDDQGNRWRSCKLTAAPSWPSYGSVDVERAGKFIALLSEVNIFAYKLLKAFPDPIVKLIETVEQVEERRQKAAVENDVARVRSLMRANLKGLRRGHERRVEVPGTDPDLLPVGRVEISDANRHYTARVSATRTFYFTRDV